MSVSAHRRMSRIRANRACSAKLLECSQRTNWIELTRHAVHRVDTVTDTMPLVHSGGSALGPGAQASPNRG